MERFSAFFCLKLSYHVFHRAERVSTNLQGKDTSVRSAMKAVSLLRTFYQQRQQKEEELNKFSHHVVEESEGFTERPVLPRRTLPPRRIDEGTQPHISSVEVYF